MDRKDKFPDSELFGPTGLVSKECVWSQIPSQDLVCNWQPVWRRSNGVCVSSPSPWIAIEKPQCEGNLQPRTMISASSPEELNVRSLMSNNSQGRSTKQSSHFLYKLFKSPETSILEVRSEMVSSNKNKIFNNRELNYFSFKIFWDFHFYRGSNIIS